MSKTYVVAAFYHFTALDDIDGVQARLRDAMDEHGAAGTILVATEGINGTIAGTRQGVDGVLAAIRSDPRLAPTEHKESYTSEMPFRRAKVRLKKEIVTLGVPGVDPTKRVGTYVPPADWNDLISRADVKLVDTRNHYEYVMGTFDGAIDPATESFRSFPDYVASSLDPQRDKKVAMFCTGGIRCEKATSYLLDQGFEEVYHLQGGILKYLEEVPEPESMWKGECFVFDERVGVDHNLAPGQYSMCRACRMPLTQEECESQAFEEGVSCPHCVDAKSEADRERFRERERQIQLAKDRGEVHIGRQFSEA